MSKVFSERFKRARMAAGLKAREMADIMGVSQGYVSQIESGKRHNLSKDLLLLAAEKMGVTVDWLVSGSGPPPKANDAVDWSEQAATAAKLFTERIEHQSRFIESQRETIESLKGHIATLEKRCQELEQFHAAISKR